jgi:hypothetical protein
MKKFIIKNLKWYHLLGMVSGLFFSILYWSKEGKFSDYFLKNNIFLISFFGIVLGYITFDLIMSSLRRYKE